MPPPPVYAEVIEEPPQQRSGMQVSISFFPLAFLLLLCTPVVVINGVRHRVSWGSHFFELPPGAYQITIFAPYLFLPECGANSVAFDLPPGTVRSVSFFMWPWIFMRGSISVR